VTTGRSVLSSSFFVLPSSDILRHLIVIESHFLELIYLDPTRQHLDSINCYALTSPHPAVNPLSFSDSVLIW